MAEEKFEGHDGRNCFIPRLRGGRGVHSGDVVGYVVIEPVRIRYWMCARHFVGSLADHAKTKPLYQEGVRYYLADSESGANDNHLQI